MKKIMITLALACGIFTAASAAKNEKPWVNYRFLPTSDSSSLKTDSRFSCWVIPAGCCRNVWIEPRHSIIFRNAV